MTSCSQNCKAGC